jgi:hypothetical protein
LQLWQSKSSDSSAVSPACAAISPPYFYSGADISGCVASIPDELRYDEHRLFAALPCGHFGAASHNRYSASGSCTRKIHLGLGNSSSPEKFFSEM